MTTRINPPTPASRAANRATARPMPISLPGHSAPGAGFEEPFELLTACHERVHRMLDLLQRLQDHLTQKGHDGSAAQAATDVLRYFNQAAPLHHQDEELHVFPPLLAAPDAHGLHAVVRRLQQDHREMEARWPLARAVLQRIERAEPGAPAKQAQQAPEPPHARGHEQPQTARSSGSPWQALSADETAALAAFAAPYRAHIEAEEHAVYPAAQALLSAEHHHTMGTEMMARRGVA